MINTVPSTPEFISVIVCTYNRERFVCRALDSLAANDFPRDRFEIVLIDNNSTDNTPQLVERFRSEHPELNLRCFREPQQGLSHARNRGIREAKGDILIFLDDDALAGPGHLRTIDGFFREHPEADCFGGKITPVFDGCTAPDWLCRRNLSWLSGLDRGDVPSKFSKSVPIGANMGFRKKTLDICGNFREDLGRRGDNLVGSEESELFRQIRRRGMNVFYIPGIEVEHLIPPERLTAEYISRFGRGGGATARILSKSKGHTGYAGRLAVEAAKWLGTVFFWAFCLITGRRACGDARIIYRLNFTRGLLRGL